MTTNANHAVPSSSPLSSSSPSSSNHHNMDLEVWNAVERGLQSSQAIPPRRPRNSYNFFFGYHRRLLQQEQEQQRCRDLGTNYINYNLSRPFPFLGNHRNKQSLQGAPLSFAHVARIVLQRWKMTSTDVKARFDDLAHQDEIRWQREMQEWRAHTCNRTGTRDQPNYQHDDEHYEGEG